MFKTLHLKTDNIASLQWMSRYPADDISPICRHLTTVGAFITRSQWVRGRGLLTSPHPLTLHPSSPHPLTPHHSPPHPWWGDRLMEYCFSLLDSNTCSIWWPHPRDALVVIQCVIDRQSEALTRRPVIHANGGVPLSVDLRKCLENVKQWRFIGLIGWYLARYTRTLPFPLLDTTAFLGMHNAGLYQS